MDEVLCYRCGRSMRQIQRLGIYFCDNDGYIMSIEDAAMNGLIRSESQSAVSSH